MLDDEKMHPPPQVDFLRGKSPRPVATPLPPHVSPTRSFHRISRYLHSKFYLPPLTQNMLPLGDLFFPPFSGRFVYFSGFS